MTERLNTAIIRLRAAVLVRRIKLEGHKLSSDDAQQLVRAQNDRDAYQGATQKVQYTSSFWKIFWWNKS